MNDLAYQLDIGHDISVEEYLSGEKTSQIKYEYVDGQVYAMVGAKLNHNRIVRNATSLLWNLLRNTPCEPLSSDMLLQTSNQKYRYPDVRLLQGNKRTNSLMRFFIGKAWDAGNGRSLAKSHNAVL